MIAKKKIPDLHEVLQHGNFLRAEMHAYIDLVCDQVEAGHYVMDEPEQTNEVWNDALDRATSIKCAWQFRETDISVVPEA